MAIGTLRVEGLRRDTRTLEERRALEAAEREPVQMRVEHVLALARERTGLDDFGSMEFVPRLALLLDEVESDPNIWNAAKHVFVEQCASAARNRLLIQDFWSRNPGSLAATIERPIEIVALPRSGSTHLENLVAADRRLQHLPVYLAAEPVPDPREQPPPESPDPRWIRAEARWEQLRSNPILAAMHEHSPDHACSENELQLPDFASYQWEWLAEVPRFHDHYRAHDQAPHYRYMRDVLKAIAWQVPSDRRWLLKSNQHSEQLPALLATYPDATIVMIHRDPVAIIQSLLTMRGLLAKNARRVPDIDGLVAYWLDRIEAMLRAYLRDRHLVPPGQLVELTFDEIIADDIAAAGRVLEAAGLPVTAQSRADLESYLHGHERGRGGRVVYDLAGDFGLDADAIRERFGFYTEAIR